MNKIANYEKLKEKFAKYSSWALWAKNDKDAIGDWSVLTDENILSNANTNYVFVGLNAAEHERGEELVPWYNFHSRDSKQKDYKLCAALQDTKYWGSYITDIIKGYECTDSAKVKAFVKNNPQKYEEQLENFKEEIKLLAGENKPVLIAMGKVAYSLLRPLKKEYQIIRIPHYSAYMNGYGNLEFYKATVREILNNN